MPAIFPSVLILLRGEEREAAVVAAHNDCRDATIIWGEGEGRVVNQSGSVRY